MAVNIPDDPAPDGYQHNPYKSILDDALEYLRAESVSTEGWEPLGMKEDVKMEKKQMPGDSSAIPLVRGRGIIKGIRPDELYPIVSHPGARVLWDPRFLEGHPLRRYARRSYKFYSIQKGAFLISQRDILGAQDAVYADDGTILLYQCSVPTDDDAPEQSGKVRATLTVGGWALRPSGENDTDATYIVKVNPAGSLPTSIINRVVAEIPICVVNVASFVHTHGKISLILQPEIRSTVRFESYEHGPRKYVAGLIGAAGDTFDIPVDTEVMYKDGFSVVLDDESGGVEMTREPSMLRIKVGGAADGKKFVITLKQA